MSAAAIERMTAPVTLWEAGEQDPRSRGYGLGWWIGQRGDYYHSGAHFTDLSIDPRSGVARVWLTQLTSEPGPTARAAFDRFVGGG